nr:hypothetical protein B0A51_13926 [Rachicladosporium sp. CCFEE 5018]
MTAPISPPRTPTTPTNPRYRKPVPIYPREQAMALNSEPADPVERESLHLPPKTYVDAAEEGLNGEQGMNEAAVNAVKETPPRKQHARISSESRPSSELHEPRALGDIIDEDERSSLSHSPSLRHVSGRLEEIIPNRETYADAVKEPVTPRSNGKSENGWARNGIAVLTGSGAEESYSGVGIDESPRSPVKHAHKRVSSRSLHASATKQAQQAHAGEGKINGMRELEEQPTSSSPTPAQASETFNGVSEKSEQADMQYEAAQAAPTASEESRIVLEPLRSKSGHDLASIAVGNEYDVRPENKEIAPRAKMPVQHKRQHSELTSGRRAGAGWSQSKIRMAPLNVPLQRRLQTAVVLMHTLSIAGGLTIFLLLCTIPLLWPILLPYLIYVLLSNAGASGDLSHRSDRWRYSKIWSLFASYFPARLHRTVELEPTRKYIFGYHPHGIISHGAFAAFATEALGFHQLFPGITNTLLTLDTNFRIPLYRDYALRMGLASVSRESCENILSKGGPNGEGMGRAITIVVGGARESLDAKPGTLRLVLKRRKGFVKLAIRSGADLCPVLAFGENDVYEQVDSTAHPYLHRFQLLVKKFAGFTVPLFHARGIFNYDVGMMPYRRPINVVVGRPIEILQSKTPDPAYVDQIHQRYQDELLRIWDEWKDTFARQRLGELEIVE